ncbi:MAG: hypothetical protein Q9201_001091 [Fulgogasparrea decipioides]
MVGFERQDGRHPCMHTAFSHEAESQRTKTRPLLTTSMDPVTAVGLAASVSQLIRVAARSVQYLIDLNSASNDQAKLLQEASHIQTLLIALRNRLEESSSDETWFNGIRSLGVENGPLDQLHEALEELATRVQPTSSAKRLGRAVKWPFEKAKCTEILNRIDRAKSMISLALQDDILYGLKFAVAV